MHVIAISSNGDVVPNDVLRNTQLWDSSTEPNIYKQTLGEIINSDLFLLIQSHMKNPPALCQECCWENICKGGSLIHRYSKKKSFDNPSIFCSSLKSFYSEVTTNLLSNGISFARINNNLKLHC